MGLGSVRNLDNSSFPGAVRINRLPVATASTIYGQPTWMVGVGFTKYMVDDTNRVYKTSDGGSTWTVIGDGSNGTGQNGTGAGQGLAMWKNYLISIGSGVDAYGPLDSSPVWTKNFTFASISLSYANLPFYCPAFASIDGCVYIGNGNVVHKIAEATAPFAPGTGASFTVTASAITLGSQYNVYHIRDVGQFLAIGTAISVLSIQAFEQSADIFPYDRSTLTLGIPIKVPENDVQQMISAKGRLYFFAGTLGKFYVTDLSSYEEVFELPDYLYDAQAGNPIFFYPGGIMYSGGKIYFTFGSNGGTNQHNIGVWSYNLKTKALQIENIISTGRDGSSNSLFVSAITPLNGKQILYGWRDLSASGTGYGTDYIDGSNRYTSYAAYIESALFRIGEMFAFSAIGYIEFILTKPLASGQGVRIKWRKSLSDNWTTLATIDFATYGAVYGYKISAVSLKKLGFLQVRAELTTSGSTSPELAAVIAHPGE